jgi:nickel-dependent lactate racemase
MKLRLAYGKEGLDVVLPDGAVTVIEPVFAPALPDQKAAISDSLRKPIGSPPLAEVVKPDDTVAVVFSDITRPAPNRLIIPIVLDELRTAGVPKDRVTLFNATGTHRLNTKEELAGMLGKRIVDEYRIVQNDARARGIHERVGTTRGGNEILIHKDFLACSFKILTGFIEPHFFAGFSGGGKAVMPGLAELGTVMRNHGARNIDNPNASWGILDGNPIREEVNEAAAMIKPDFLVNVALNKNREVTGSFAGGWIAAFAAGTEFVRKTAMAGVDRLFDIVITSNSGYPLDLNLYQAVKGMSAAERITKPCGSVVIASECRDGVPDHGSFGALMRESGNADDLLARIRSSGFMRDDQWQAQILAKIVKRVDVYVYTAGLTADQLLQAKVRPCASIEGQVLALMEKYGNQAEICVLPEGPQTIPYIVRTDSRLPSRAASRRGAI